jgi:hypothetical protein
MDNTQNIDKLAQSFFIVLVFCSVASDSYIFMNNILKNSYVKKKINYVKKMYKIARGLTLQNYVNDEEGNIIIDDDDIRKDNNENNTNENKDDKESIHNQNIDDNLESLSKKQDESDDNKEDSDIEDELNDINEEVLGEPTINNETKSELYTEDDVNPIKEILENNNNEKEEQSNQIEREYFENTNSIPNSMNVINKSSSDCSLSHGIEVKKPKKSSKKNIKEVIIKHSNKKIKNDKIKK